jgi:hypothetical protein
MQDCFEFGKSLRFEWVRGPPSLGGAEPALSFHGVLKVIDLQRI